MYLKKILNTALILSSLIFLMPSCEKESQEEMGYKHAMANVEFTCPDTTTSMYFHGFLNGRELCYYAGIEGYSAQAAVANGYQTYAPFIDFSDTSTFQTSGTWFQFGFVQEKTSDFLEEFIIEAPVDTFGSGFIGLVEKHLKQDTLKIRDEESEAELGFNIKISIPYSPNNNGGFILYQKMTATGNQEGSQFIVTKLEMSESFGHYNYDIEAELNCRLYNPFNVLGNGEFFGEITDGELVIRISVPK